MNLIGDDHDDASRQCVNETVVRRAPFSHGLRLRKVNEEVAGKLNSTRLKGENYV